jgi:hypothetical protein
VTGGIRPADPVANRFPTRRKGDQMSRIDRRDDVDPKDGEREYGDVEFADPVNNKYPIDSEKHVRAAWSYINKQGNAAKYDADDLKTIRSRIIKAAKKYDIEIEEGA